MSSATRYEYPRIDDAWKSYCIRRGKTRVRVSSWYRASVKSILRDLKALFDKHDFNSFPVVDAGKMVGIVIKFDFLSAFVFTTIRMVPHYDDLMKRQVQQIMTETVSSMRLVAFINQSALPAGSSSRPTGTTGKSGHS